MAVGLPVGWRASRFCKRRRVVFQLFSSWRSYDAIVRITVSILSFPVHSLQLGRGLDRQRLFHSSCLMRSMADHCSDEHRRLLKRISMPGAKTRLGRLPRCFASTHAWNLRPHICRNGSRMAHLGRGAKGTNHAPCSLIKAGTHRAEQVVPRASYQIHADCLESEPIEEAAVRKGRPCRGTRHVSNAERPQQ